MERPGYVKLGHRLIWMRQPSADLDVTLSVGR